MPDNQPISNETRVLLQEMLYQLTAIYDASGLKKGIYYGAVIDGRGFTIKFERDTTIDGSTSEGNTEAKAG